MAWETLPDVVIIEIYVLLRDEDRLRMSLSCKNWHRLFASPILWQSRRIHFIGNRMIDSPTRKQLLFLKKFGHFLKNLKVSFAVPTYRTAKRITNSAQIFFKALTDTRGVKLHSLTLVKLEFQYHWHYWVCCHKIISALCRLLRRARHLQYLHAVSSCFSLTDGCRILESLDRGRADKTLKRLFIEEFFLASIKPCTYRRYLNVIGKFKNVSVVFMSYYMLSGQVLDIFAKNMKNSLTKIILSLENDVDDIITAEQWNRFTASCIGVKLSLYLHISGDSDASYDITTAFVTGLPLYGLYVISYGPGRNDDTKLQQVPALLRHVTVLYHNTLEKLTLKLQNPPPLDEELISLLQGCTRIKCLVVTCQLKTVTLQHLCTLQAKHELNLTSLCLHLHGLSAGDLKSLSDVRVTLVDSIKQLEFAASQSIN